MEPSLGYTGVHVPGHNLWPYKLVTRIFEDAQATANEKGSIEVMLHTKTPVTGFERVWAAEANKQQHHDPIRGVPMAAAGKAPEIITNADDPAQTQQRKWKLQTPRGSISCNYVVHATNGYAGHLLPFLAGANSNATSPQTEEFQHPLSNYGLPRPKPRGMYGIIPTRGQVGAIRASVRAEDLGWRNSWVGAEGGWEYWFPRYQGLEGTNGSAVNGIETGSGSENENGTTQAQNTGSRNPLIILGGGRHNAGGNMESGETDDGVLNERIGKALREFLPRQFPGKFKDGGQGWEMEWVSNTLTFFQKKILHSSLRWRTDDN